MRSMAQTMNEQYLDIYLDEYAKGSDETEKRQRECAICGDKFDLEECFEIRLYMDSTIKIQGKRPNSICLCKWCYESVEKIESEDDYEY